MSDVESENFENADLISLVSVVEPPKPSIQDEIGRGQKIYRNRRGLKEQSAAEKILPLYEKPGQTKKKSCKTRPSYYYRLICEELKDGRQRSYKACKHSGNCVLDRDILTRREHDTFLAQPRLVPKTKNVRPYCYYVKKHFAPCTHRIEQLALPKKQRLVALWNENAHKISAQQSENIARMLIDANFTSIERAMELCNDENQKHTIAKSKIRRAASKVKKKIIKEKKIIVLKIALNIFKAMQEFLLTNQDVTFNQQAKAISDVIADKIIRFGGYDAVERNSDDILAKCIYGLADNLAIWMQKITQVCNFGSVMDEAGKLGPSPAICPCGPQQTIVQYPIDDFIEYESSEVETDYATSDIAPDISEARFEFEGEEGELDLSEVDNVIAEGDTEPAPEAEAELADEPDVKPAIEPDVEPATEPDVDPAAGPGVDPAAGPDVDPAAGPDVEPAAEADAEPAVEPDVEAAGEPEA